MIPVSIVEPVERPSVELCECERLMAIYEDLCRRGLGPVSPAWGPFTLAAFCKCKGESQWQ